MRRGVSRMDREVGPATTWARKLLAHLGLPFRRVSSMVEPHPQVDWARSGGMWLTGWPEGPPRCIPVPLASCARGAMLALAALAPQARLPEGPELLGERAAIAGHGRQGDISPGGSCRLVRASDGSLAINLTRDTDWELLAALLDGESVASWHRLQLEVARYPASELLARGRLLGLAVAMVEPEVPAPEWCKCLLLGRSVAARRRARPRVVDLSSLWAGPLCAQLFGLLGAEVVKVESLSRPDGARMGPADFFDLLNAGKSSVALDLDCEQGRRQLRALLHSADIVIESSRPRAMRQLGIHAEELLKERPGKTWISITGYGRDCDEGMRAAFGDDAGVAGGLTQALALGGAGEIFCGDAIADPLAGLHAAVVGWADWLAGGGCLLDISMAGVVAHAFSLPRYDNVPVLEDAGDWWLDWGSDRTAVLPPRARPPSGCARSLGADTDRYMAEVTLKC